jgi:hypothetical protein
MSSMISYTSEMRFRIDPTRVLSRMGKRGAQDRSAPLRGLQEAISAVLAASEAKLARLRLPAGRSSEGALVIGDWAPGSADLSARLDGCCSCTMFMLTLGAALDRLLESAARAPSRQVLLDAAASEAAEDCARWVQRTESSEASRAGRKALPRFSPGFGDFGLENQRFFVDNLTGLGVEISAGGLLLPRKTVTGVIGWK